MSTSKGLSGLSHFSQSRVSTSMWEPVYKNLFTVAINLPAALGADEESTNILLEGVQKVSGLDTTKVPAVVLQHYRGSDRSFIGAMPETTFVDVKLDFEVNVIGGEDGKVSLQQVKLLRRWCDLCYDPLSGRSNVKSVYTAPSMQVTLHDKNGNPLWYWNFKNVFPTTPITSPELDFSQKTELYKITDFTLRCDVWDEGIM
jgi:hypothetical protein